MCENNFRGRKNKTILTNRIDFIIGKEFHLILDVTLFRLFF